VQYWHGGGAGGGGFDDGAFGGFGIFRPNQPRSESIATQTDPLARGYVARIGTLPATPLVLLIFAPLSLCVAGVSYTHNWRVNFHGREVEAGHNLPVPWPMALYPLLLGIGFIITNAIVFPTSLRAITDDTDRRIRGRYTFVGTAAFTICFAFPTAICEYILLENYTNTVALETRSVSIVSLVLLSVSSVVLLWLKYTAWAVEWFSRRVRKHADLMLGSGEWQMAQQRPGVAETPLAKMTRQTPQKGKRAAGQPLATVGTVTPQRSVTPQPRAQVETAPAAGTDAADGDAEEMETFEDRFD
jgi:hypothetical protein